MLDTLLDGVDGVVLLTSATLFSIGACRRDDRSAARWTAGGAKKTCVMMEHLTWAGESEIVATCTHPLTGIACVSRLYTDLAGIDVTAAGLQVVEILDGLDCAELQRLTGVLLIP